MRGSSTVIPDTVPSVSQKNSALLEFADVVFASVVVTPTVIVYWQSAWTLMDLYIYPDHQIISNTITAITGMFLNLLLCVFQTHFSEYLNPDRGRVTYFVLSRLYTVVAGIACIGAVRGMWNLMNHCIEDTAPMLLGSTVASTVLLAALRTLKNICAIPFVVVVDSPRDHFEMPTFFRRTFRETVLYILDCIFSVVVLGILVVFVWRGLWNLADLLFFPEEPIESYLISLAIGYGLAIVTFAIQGPMRRTAARLEGARKVLLADVNNLVSFVATINVWRGICGLLDDYLFPDKLISSWCSHIASLLILVLLKCFNTVLARGVYIDAEEPDDECVIFPCHYLRLDVYKRLEKKATNTDTAMSKMEEASEPLQLMEGQKYLGRPCMTHDDTALVGSRSELVKK